MYMTLQSDGQRRSLYVSNVITSIKRTGQVADKTVGLCLGSADISRFWPVSSISLSCYKSTTLLFIYVFTFFFPACASAHSPSFTVCWSHRILWAHSTWLEPFSRYGLYLANTGLSRYQRSNLEPFEWHSLLLSLVFHRTVEILWMVPL